MASQNWVNIGSGIGLLSGGTKPSRESMLVCISEDNFTGDAQDMSP